MENVTNVTWDEYRDIIKDMAEKIEYYCDPDLIVGIQRGGLVPAVSLSHHFKCSMEVIKWTTRDGDEKEHNINVAQAIEDGKQVVFVDDINDSGRTLAEVHSHYDNSTHKCLYATMFAKTHSSEFNADVVSLGIAKEDESKWVVFPWEVK